MTKTFQYGPVTGKRLDTNINKRNSCLTLFPVGVDKHWSTLPKEAEESPSL